MATVETSTKRDQSKEELREQWLERLAQLVTTVRGWAQDLDWSTRQIEKKIESSQIGTYKAPALLLQRETVRVLLEPISHSAPGVEGIVDFYLMSAYDDIARLYVHDAEWKLCYVFPAPTAVATARELELQPLTRELFQSVLEAMTRDAE